METTTTPGVPDQFLDYLWAVAQDEGEAADIRTQAIRTLGQVYTVGLVEAGRRITAAGVLVGLTVGLALCLFVGLVLA